MAKAKESKIVLERTYNVPLRKEVLKTPKYKRAHKAMMALRQFLAKHMKSDQIIIGRHANMKVWEQGMRNPPHHIQVIAKKDDEGKVMVELVGAPVDKPVEVKPAKGKAKKDALEEKVKEVKEEQAEKAKEIEKEEIKELKKEHPPQHKPKDATMPKNVEAHPSAPSGRNEMRKP